MKRWIVVTLGLTAACGGGTAGGGPTPAAVGAATPEAAVTAFLAAAKDRDLQAMSVVWGTAKGPARETMARAELERRELIMMQVLCPEQSRVVERQPGEAGKVVLRMELSRPGMTKTPRFTTVAGPGGRWYVEDFEIASLQDFCRTGR